MPDSPRLHLPPLKEIEETLDLEEEDREPIAGLYNLNARQVPMARVVGMQVLAVAAWMHNVLVLGNPLVDRLVPLVVGLELYAAIQWVTLRVFFTRFRRFHLGTLFLVLDLLVFTWIIHATGGPRSWLWPLYLLRVADQMWIGRRRAAAMGGAGVVLYVLLLAITAQGPGAPVAPDPEVMKLTILVGMTAYLVGIAGLPWNLQERTRTAKELILKLEDQSLELDREREKAEEASRAKTEFLARMSHELRTPLNSVVGFTNVLLKNKNRSLQKRELDYLGRIRTNGLHLLALINDILDLSRIEEGKMDIQTTDVDVETMVRDTVRQLEGRLLGSPVRLFVSFPRRLGPLRADEARLRQVLINLLGNAIKFTPEGWIRVEVRTAAEDSDRPYVMEVRDTGVGIEAHRLAHIFAAFEQGDGTTARRHGGTGLGLAISRSLCTLMGFDLTVESALHEGSAFTVWFSPPEERPT